MELAGLSLIKVTTDTIIKPKAALLEFAVFKESLYI
jgi:hypothetical protein